jgi:SOS response regulatory protein OraA/RecX
MSASGSKSRKRKRHRKKTKGIEKDKQTEALMALEGNQKLNKIKKIEQKRLKKEKARRGKCLGVQPILITRGIAVCSISDWL